MSTQSRVSIPDIQLKLIYGYAPNKRKIIQIVSASNLKLGKNSIKIEDPKLYREIKANPEIKLIPSLTFYPSLDPKYTNIVNNDTSGQVYYPPEKTYYENIPEEKLLNMLIGVDFTDPINDAFIDIEEGNCEFGYGYLPGCGCVPWSNAQLGICSGD
jgi:hypothetical protein